MATALRLAALCLVSTMAVSTAQAATKVCLGPVVQGTIDVPPHPRFVLANEPRNREAQASEKLQVRNTRGELLGDHKVFGHSDKVIDAYRFSRTVRAEKGQTFVMPTAHERCATPRYRVTSEWKRKAGAPRPITAALSSDQRSVVLTWRAAEQLAWIRVDWAYRRADIEHGLFGSRYQVEEKSSSRDLTVHLPIAAGARRIHLRLTRFHLDGTESRWHGWLERDAQGRLRIRPGKPPVEASPAALDLSACADAADARPVPVDPTFRVSWWDTPRFIAVTPRGTHLALASRIVADHPRHVGVTVHAREGQRFWLRRLPLGKGCPSERLLVATADRSGDEAPVVTSAQVLGCSADLEIEDPDTWGYFDVTSRAMTNEEVPAYLAEDQTVASGLGAPTMYSSPLAVTITPVWANGQRGAAWTGWVRSEGCDTASFGTLDAIPSQPEVMAPAAPELPARSCSAKRCGVERWGPVSVLFSLALGWLLYRRHRRRADRHMWV